MSLHCVSREALAEKLREHSLHSIYEIIYLLHRIQDETRTCTTRAAQTNFSNACERQKQKIMYTVIIVLSEGNFVLCSRLFLYRLLYCMDSTILNIPKLFSSLYEANCYELSKNENKNRIRLTSLTGLPFSSFPYLKMQILRFFCFKRFKSMLKSF